MRLRTLTLITVVALAGCDPDSEPVGQSEGSGTGSGSDSDSNGTQGDPTTGDSASGTTADDSATTIDPSTSGVTSVGSEDTGQGEASGSSETGITCSKEKDCAPCPDGTVLDTYCDDDGLFVCECIPAGSDCDLPTYVQDAAEGKTTPVDCGTVTLEDSAQDYAAATDCVLQHSEMQEAYTMVAQLQGIDSSVWAGYAGTVGFVYGEASFMYDGGGLAGGEFIWRQDCTPTLVPDCSPGPGAGTCLTCDAKSTLVCSDPDA